MKARKKMKPKKTASKSRQSSSKTKTKSRNFSFTRKWQVATFVVAFAIVGGFFLLRTYAATTGTVTSSGTCTKNCYTYYPMEPKIAFWINDIRKQNGAQYLPLNDCMSSFARNWSARNGPLGSKAHYADVYGMEKWKAEIQKCLPANNGYMKFGENTIIAPSCRNASDADCAWQIVIGSKNANGTPGSWYTSPTHQKTMLDKTYMVQGIGIWKNPYNGDVYATAEFACYSNSNICPL